MDSPQRTSLVGVVLAVALALGVGACDPVDVPGGAALAPSPFSSSFIGAMLVPETLAFVSVPIFGCPQVAPFRSSFSLVIDQRRGPDVFFHEAELRFVDVSGVASPLQKAPSTGTGRDRRRGPGYVHARRSLALVMLPITCTP